MLAKMIECSTSVFTWVHFSPSIVQDNIFLNLLLKIKITKKQPPFLSDTLCLNIEQMHIKGHLKRD